MSTATNTFGPYRLDEMLGEGGSTGGRPAGRRRGPDRGPRSAVHPTAGPRTCTAEPPVRHGRRLLPIGVVLAVVALLVATWGLTSRAGPPLDAGLTATIDQRSLLGEVTAAGTVRPFAAQVATGVGGGEK